MEPLFTPILHLQLPGRMVHLLLQRKELSFIKSATVPFRVSFKDKKAWSLTLNRGVNSLSGHCTVEGSGGGGNARAYRGGGE